MELKTLDTALSLLAHFTPRRPEWGVRELSGELGLSRSVVHRMLATFEHHGFLSQSAQTGKYALGVRFWEFGVMFRDRFEVAGAVAAMLQEGADSTGETFFLALLQGDESICTQIAESSESVKVAINLGERTPLPAGSRGKVILAFLPEPRQQSILSTATTGMQAAEARAYVEKIRIELAKIRVDGWCMTQAERLTGVVGMSVPIFDRQGNVVGSVALGGPRSRMTKQKLEQCLSVVKAVGLKIQNHFQEFS
jgi:DNA-binding IclR family transcriptional regulator